MVIAYKTGKKIPLVNLGEKSLEYGCFNLNKKDFKLGNFNKSLDGLFYEPFIKFIREEFALKGKIISPLVFGDILSELDKGNLIIASVERAKNLGGHLILITGYNLTNEVFFINDPSALNEASKLNSKITFTKFKHWFNHKGISVHINNFLKWFCR